MSLFFFLAGSIITSITVDLAYFNLMEILRYIKSTRKERERLLRISVDLLSSIEKIQRFPFGREKSQ